MDALIASYGDNSSDSELESQPPVVVSDHRPPPATALPPPPATALPPPPIDLLNPPNTLGTFDYLERNTGSRIRSFPHVEGNYALHVYIPGVSLEAVSLPIWIEERLATTYPSQTLLLSGIYWVCLFVWMTCASYAIVFIPSERKKELAQFLKKAASLIPGLHVVDIDVPLLTLLKDEEKLVQAALGREFHISLGRTVPIRKHQIDSVVAMLRQKLQFQKRYLIDFNKWEVFVNDDKTRTFLSVENTAGGLAEIMKQILAVNEVYKLHNLPEFYKDPRPHISIAWAVGDISQSVKRVVEEGMKTRVNVGGLPTRCMFTCKFNNIACKIGNKTYNICGSQSQGQ